jgi:hypothetical protein
MIEPGREMKNELVGVQGNQICFAEYVNSLNGNISRGGAARFKDREHRDM